ncbi:hypothetical protein FY557_13055 [Chryseobacterium sp. SN22]|uniref:hypothetical protein n=1 Tax=Chryseobacterium sp. SN22 TaxID=2606431 RepID=UPI0011EEB03B|nr:hypothetical protein [Chryseobacterium sp. SN22]KAA0127541.1 hypothetical protein FY557_13055 [Chryseobacterium sp. SN22]
MSKIKLLLNEVFQQAKLDSGKTKKYPLALYLKIHLETFNVYLDEKTFVRYYDAYVLEKGKETEPDSDTLNKLSHYLGYKDFTDFSRTFVKKDDETNKTTVKISVDDDEESLAEKLSKIVINITNEQYFKVPDFLKKNGMGIVEMVFLVLLVTGGVVFSKDKKSVFGFSSIWNDPAIEKPYMYWDKDRYIASDSSFINPQTDVVPMDPTKFVYQKKITRPDTLTIENAVDKVWYDKSDNHVEFFTNYGTHPENGKTLKAATPHIVETYGGENASLELADN